MPDHPNPSMDERLRTYAHQRRAQAGPPPALHLATRRLLQGEVTRIHGRRAAGPAGRQGWFAAWGAPLAWCASVAALVGLVTLVLRYQPAHAPRPARSEVQIGAPSIQPLPEPKRDHAAQDKRVEPFTAKPASQILPPAPTLAAAAPEPARPAGAGADPTQAPRIQSQPAATQQVESVLTESPAALPLTAAAPASQISQPGLETLARDEAPAQRYGLRPATKAGTDSFRGVGAIPPPRPEASSSAPTAPAAALTVNATSRTGDRLEEGPTKAKTATVETAGIRFTQMDPRSNLRRNFQSPAKPEVLTSFQFVQDAGQVRVVDADGSVYTGQLATEVAKGAQQSKGPGTAGASAAPAASRGADSSRILVGEGIGAVAQTPTLTHGQTFRVTGTNVTLQQEVEFSGTFLLTNTLAGSRAGVPVKAAPGPSRSTVEARYGARTNLPPSPAQFLLRGRATIGGSNRFEIQARPTKP